jgi:signal-transduction protein with cAMP-binding, CBS, and nucleotidyltransferase domain
MNFKKKIKERYNDENFRFRSKMIKNVPYFKNLSDSVIQELVYLLKPAFYDKDAFIVRKGDSTDRIFFLKTGTIEIEISLRKEKMHFDSLNPGSCFCLFSAFHEDKKQKFDFRAKFPCYVETISSRDIISL